MQVFYPQGGFAIGATTARHAENADFDIDAMAQLTVHPDSDPEDVLATLHKAIKGEPGSRYWDKTDRKSRCVTVLYDGMHLDVTPAVRRWGTDEQISQIYHSKKLRDGYEKDKLLANPFGFADWFSSMIRPRRLSASSSRGSRLTTTACLREQRRLTPSQCRDRLRPTASRGL